MARLILFSILIAGLAILSACATLDENECKLADWRQLGDRDGSQGYPSGRIAQHAKACGKHGLPVDDAAYRAGWQAGIGRYCVAQNGFDLGRRGGSYRNSCPPPLAAPFEAAYRPARDLFDAERELEDAENRIDDIIHEIERLSYSHRPEDLKRLRETSERLHFERSDIPRLQSNLLIARRNADDYLRAPPHIRAL